MQKTSSTLRIDLYDVIMFIDVVALIFFILLFDMKAFGRYVYLALSLLAYGVCIYRGNGKIKLLIGEHQLHLITMIFAICLTSLWAIDLSDVLEKAVTLTEIFLCFYGVYYYFYSTGKLSLLLDALKWSGFLIALYCLLIYGYDTLSNAAAGQASRFTDGFANVNSISNLIASSCLLEFWDILNKKSRLLALFFIPSFIVIFAFQCRKAFVFLFLGFIGLILLQTRGKHRLFRVMLSLIVFAVAFIIMSRLDIFKGVMERINSMLNLFTGRGKVDNSTHIRHVLIQVGIQTWLQNPIGGIGIGCSHYMAAAATGNNYYLHNNYAELLSGGGIIGFAAYYWFYVYLLFKLFKIKKNDHALFSLALVWLALLLIMDYGSVSFYSKIQWIYLMTLYLIYAKMKTKGTQNEQVEDNKQTEQGKKIVPVCN